MFPPTHGAVLSILTHNKNINGCSICFSLGRESVKLGFSEGGDLGFREGELRFIAGVSWGLARGEAGV